MEIKRLKNKKILWEIIVGKEIVSPQKTRIICTAYEDNKLFIGEWINDTQGYTNVITTLDEQRALKQLELLGYELMIVDSNILLSDESKSKIKGLIQAGFINLCKANDNFKIDNLFIQNFLLKSELDYLLSLNSEIISLNDLNTLY